MAGSKILFLWLLALQAASCSNPLPPQAEKAQADTASLHPRPSFLNDIRLRTKGGLLLSSAYLTTQDGQLLPPTNNLLPTDTVYLHLQVAEGWTSRGGRISLGAEQIITTSAGQPVLRLSDLFARTPEMPEAEGARLLLSAAFKQAGPATAQYVVTFRVWDRYGPAEVAGSYRLTITDAEN